MQLFSQRDSKWTTMKLGNSSLTLGRFGCTTTCLAMLTDYFGCLRLPPAIAGTPQNYTADGLIQWKALDFPCMKFEWRSYIEDVLRIQEALKNPARAVMLQVNYGAHWVVALRKTLLGNDYVIADPWDGKQATAKGRYKNITGAAYFVKK